MATITKCDKCDKKILKEQVRLSVNDTYGIAGEKRLFYEYFDLCADCAKKSLKILAKVFPNLLVNNKSKEV